MKLSRFYHEVPLKNSIYAIYNSLIMDVIYVNEEKLSQIKKLDLLLDEIKLLKEKGILISDDKQDEEALLSIKKRYDMITGKIQILYLILSSSCNLACKYCFIENGEFNNKKEINMSKDIAFMAISKYAKYLEDENIKEGLIIFYGGEPFVNWTVMKEVINYAKKITKRLKFSVVTNATLLDEEKIKFLAENEVEVGISIDGPKKLNDKNRIYRYGHKSVYDLVVTKFPQLSVHNCKYGLSITVSNDLLLYQDEVLQWLKELGVTSIFYNLYHYTSYSNDWEKYYNEASAFLLKSYQMLSPEGIYDGRMQRKLDSILQNEFKFSDCGAIGGNQLTVKPNGDVCICHGYLKTDKYVMGNIEKNTIKEMLVSDEMAFWRNRNTLNNAECLKCPSLFICGGGCAIQAEALFGNRSNIDLPFCIHTKSSLQWILQTSYDLMIKNREKEVV